MPTQQVKVGQIWRDNDKRAQGRLLKIIEINQTHARCEVMFTPRKTMVRLDRFRPTSTGYVLRDDAS